MDILVLFYGKTEMTQILAGSYICSMRVAHQSGGLKVESAFSIYPPFVGHYIYDIGQKHVVAAKAHDGLDAAFD